MAEPLRVVAVLKDGNVFVAQCLEIDIAAQGLSNNEALMRLQAVLRAEAQLAEFEGRNITDIGAAPERFHLLYGSEVVGRTEMRMVA